MGGTLGCVIHRLFSILSETKNKQLRFLQIHNHEWSWIIPAETGPLQRGVNVFTPVWAGICDGLKRGYCGVLF